MKLLESANYSLLKKNIKRELMPKYYSEIKRLPELTEPGTKTALILKKYTTASITRGTDQSGATMIKTNSYLKSKLRERRLKTSLLLTKWSKSK